MIVKHLIVALALLAVPVSAGAEALYHFHEHLADMDWAYQWSFTARGLLWEPAPDPTPGFLSVRTEDASRVYDPQTGLRDCRITMVNGGFSRGYFESEGAIRLETLFECGHAAETSYLDPAVWRYPDPIDAFGTYALGTGTLTITDLTPAGRESVSVTSVPEPASALLMLAGALLVRRRRLRREEPLEQEPHAPAHR